MSNQKLYDITLKQLADLGFNMDRSGSQIIQTVIMMYVQDKIWKKMPLSHVLREIREDDSEPVRNIEANCRSMIRDSFLSNREAYTDCNQEWCDTPPTTYEFCSYMSEYISFLYRFTNKGG